MVNMLGRLLCKSVAALAFVLPVPLCCCHREVHAVKGSRVALQDDSSLSLPADYRDWRLISVAHEAGKVNDLRAIMGNDQAMSAYRSDVLPFPDGAIITRVAWAYTSSELNNRVFGQNQSFVAGTPINVQLMIKDSKRFASTGGWGFAQFDAGRRAPPEATKPCFSCHTPARQQDYVFTRYAP